MCTELIVIAQMIQFCVTVDLLHSALHKLQSAYLAASVHSSQTCNADKTKLLLFFYCQRKPVDIVTAHVRMHQHSVTTCWTAYFGTLSCVTKLKPLTRHHCALYSRWPTQSIDCVTFKAILGKLPSYLCIREKKIEITLNKIHSLSPSGNT